MTLEKNKFSILVAEDNPDDYFLLQMAIIEANEDIHIYHVYNGAQLMEFLLQEGVNKKLRHHANPDLIITDLKMPFVDGLQVVKKVRDLDQFKHIPVYLFSDNDSDSNKAKAVETGATRFYRKPHTFAQLQSIIREILKENKVL
jgi:two-component system response regulator